MTGRLFCAVMFLFVCVDLPGTARDAERDNAPLFVMHKTNGGANRIVESLIDVCEDPYGPDRAV